MEGADEGLAGELFHGDVRGEVGGVEEERQAVLVADGAGGLDVGHAHGLAAAGVVGDGQHHDGHTVAADLGDEGLQRGDIHVPFEGVAVLRVGGFVALIIEKGWSVVPPGGTFNE